MTKPLDPAGAALEAEVPASERHGRGQYFTPEPLIDFVLDRLRDDGVRPDRGVVLDPSCGSGRFLMAARARWPGVHVRGYETDEAALGLARKALPDGDIDGGSFLDATAPGDVDLIVGNPPYLRDRGAKRDLYVAFVERAWAHLKDGGTLALVLSNAWLDVEYGVAVRAALTGRAAITWIVESSGDRWFPGAKVHTMVLIARRCDDPDERARSRVRFATVERLSDPPDVRRSVLQTDLPDGAWGPLLRASDLYLETRRAAEPLGERFQVRRGFTTNDNGYFYPPPAGREAIEDSALRPVFRSPKRVLAVRAKADELPDKVFLGGVGDGPGAAAWVRDHHESDPPVLTARIRARQFLLKGYADRFRQPLFDRDVLCDQQLYAVTPRWEVDPRAVAAMLNSTWAHLALEYTGRVNFGDGVLWLGLRDARDRLRLPRPRPDDEPALAHAFDELPNGAVPKIGGLYVDPAWGPAMRRLDAVVGSLLGLTEDEQEALREELVRRTARRCGSSSR